jgi:hypothetical protein
MQPAQVTRIESRSGDSDDVCWAIPALSGAALDALRVVVRANRAVDVHNAGDDATTRRAAASVTGELEEAT